MAIATVSAETRPVHHPPDEADLKAGQRDAPSLALAVAVAKPLRSSSPTAGSQLASLAPPPFYRAMPTSGAFALRAEDFAPATRGYAPVSSASKALAASAGTSAAASAAKSKTTASKTTASKTTASKTTASKTTASKTSTARDLAFLDDKSTSIEDKLFRFMTLMAQKNDQELVDAMKEYEDKKSAASKSSSGSSASSSPSQVKPAGGSQQESSGGGLFGAIGDALGGIGKALVGGAESLVKDLGGPVLAGVATAVGLPVLAPVALKVGGDLGAGIIEGVASSIGLGKSSSSASSSTKKSGTTASSGSSSTKSTSSTPKSTSSTSTSASAATDGEFDEKIEMLKLQRLVEKQNAMFSAITNAMKTMHESQMNAVQNIR